MSQKKYVPLIAFLAGMILALTFSTYATDIGTNATITGSLFATSTVQATGNILTYGKLGVGTTTPTAALAINAPGDVPGLLIGSSTATNFIVDKNGNVGIGTGNPVQKLDVVADSGSVSIRVKSAAASDSTANLQILTDGTNRILLNDATSGGKRFDLVTGGSQYGAGSFAGKFVIEDANVNGARLLIDSSGNVGIGTTSTASLLTVSGKAPALFLSDSSVGGAVNGKHRFLLSQGGAFSVGTTTNAFNATSTQFTITSKGNVGINTTSPGYLFSIQSANTGATTTAYLGTGGSTTNGSCLQMHSPNGTAYRLYVSNAGALTTQAGTCE